MKTFVSEFILTLKRLAALLFATTTCFLGYSQSATPVTAEIAQINAAPATFRYTGTITAKREAALSPRVAGLVSIANAEAGFEARKGDVLVSLDNTLAKIELAEQTFALEAANAERDNAERLLNEAKQLGDANFPRTEREARKTALRLAEVGVQRAAAAVQRQQEILERHQIIAPFDGVVVSKNAEIGEWVQTGNTVLHFISAKNLRLDIEVPQEQLDVILESPSVSVSLSGRNASLLTARIEARSPKVDPKTRTFMVRLALEKTPNTVKPGMSAEAVFQHQPDKPQLIISRDAIIRYGDGKTIVWAIETSKGESRATRREVTLGSTRGSLIEVLSGIAPDESFVVRGNESLQEGQAIVIVDSDPINLRGN